MQIILTQDVPHLGSLGDEVHVKDGYARNYLLPRGLAIASSSRNAAQIEHRKRHLAQLRQKAIEVAKAEGEKVASLELTVRAKAGAGGRLFGSVTNRDLQAALKDLGYDLDRRSIVLEAPIKSVGSFSATVKLHSEVKTEVKVKVLPIELTEEEKKALEAEAAAQAAAEAAPAEGAAPAGGAEAAPAQGQASEAVQPEKAEAKPEGGKRKAKAESAEAKAEAPAEKAKPEGGKKKAKGEAGEAKGKGKE
jgi:large subunit ribosomal protein L9